MAAVKRVRVLTIVLVLLGLAVPLRAARAAELVGMAADTVRTNLWLTESLMAEIVTAAAASLPPAPAGVLLQARRTGDPRDEVFGSVAAEVLGEAGYDLYVDSADSLPTDPIDYVLSYRVQGIDLSYPEVGRTLGLWRRWIERELDVAVMVEIAEKATGRLLLNERLERRYGDRLDSDDFDFADTDAYDFTTAATRESGWKGRAEEIVVLGTLAGLVAIYFANTGN